MDPRCPVCQEATALTRENRWRPFCSERCKLVDLGRWLGEEYVIGGPPAMPDLDRADDQGLRRIV